MYNIYTYIHINIIFIIFIKIGKIFYILYIDIEWHSQRGFGSLTPSPTIDTFFPNKPIIYIRKLEKT